MRLSQAMVVTGARLLGDRRYICKGIWDENDSLSKGM